MAHRHLSPALPRGSDDRPRPFESPPRRRRGRGPRHSLLRPLCRRGSKLTEPLLQATPASAVRVSPQTLLFSPGVELLDSERRGGIACRRREPLGSSSRRLSMKGGRGGLWMRCRGGFQRVGVGTVSGYNQWHRGGGVPNDCVGLGLSYQGSCVVLANL